MCSGLCKYLETRFEEWVAKVTVTEVIKKLYNSYLKTDVTLIAT